MIKTYEDGKLTAVQLTEWEQYDLALKNNRSLREQKFKEAEIASRPPEILKKSGAHRSKKDYIRKPKHGNDYRGTKTEGTE